MCFGIFFFFVVFFFFEGLSLIWWFGDWCDWVGRGEEERERGREIGERRSRTDLSHFEGKEKGRKRKKIWKQTKEFLNMNKNGLAFLYHS